MTAWDFAFTAREFVLDLCLLGALLVGATVLRRFVPVFQRYLIPNNLIAGFLGLALGPEVLDWVGFSIDRMGVYVYHLLALTFISMGLRKLPGKRSVGAIHVGFAKVMTYLLQALLGLLVALGFYLFISRDLHPAVGMLLPLGFGMNPGIAYNIGASWEGYGLSGGGSIGLTLAAVGFLIAYLSGITLVNRGLRRGEGEVMTDASHLGLVERTGLVKDNPEVGGRLTFFSGAIDTLTFHAALVGGIYFLAYGVTYLLDGLLTQAGLFQERATLWSLTFLIANLIALLCRFLMGRLGIDYVLDEGFLNRLTGLSVDLLVTAAIMGISLGLAWQYAGPIAVMALLGATATYLSLRWTVPLVFRRFRFERTVGLYAEQTGTISSGLALIRVTDPEYQTPVAQDQVLGSGTALVLGFPLLLVINLPVVRYGGTLEGYAVTLGVLAAYLVLNSLLWWLYARRVLRSSSPAS